MNSFYITLLSDRSPDIYPLNTQCCFKTKLPHAIHIDKENWELALAEIIVPSQFINIGEEDIEFAIISSDVSLFLKIQELKNKKFQIYEKGVTDNGEVNKWGCSFKIKPGSYSSPTHLLETIDGIIHNALGSIFLDNNQVFRISYSLGMNRPKFSFDHILKTGIKFSENLFLKLGGNPTYIGKTFYPSTSVDDFFPYMPNLNAGYNHLFVYSDIVDYSILGHIQSPILRVLPFKTSNSFENNIGNQHTHHDFLNLHYIPVAKSDFDTIHINIRGDSGNPVQFVNGKSMVKLHFRRRI